MAQSSKTATHEAPFVSLSAHVRPDGRGQHHAIHLGSPQEGLSFDVVASDGASSSLQPVYTARHAHDDPSESTYELDIHPTNVIHETRIETDGTTTTRTGGLGTGGSGSAGTTSHHQRGNDGNDPTHQAGTQTRHHRRTGLQRRPLRAPEVRRSDADPRHHHPPRHGCLRRAPSPRPQHARNARPRHPQLHGAGVRPAPQHWIDGSTIASPGRSGRFYPRPDGQPSRDGGASSTSTFASPSMPSRSNPTSSSIPPVSTSSGPSMPSLALTRRRR